MNYRRRELELRGWRTTGVIERHAIEIRRESVNRPLNSKHMKRVGQAREVKIYGEEVPSVADLADTGGHVVVPAGDHCRAEQ